MTTLLVLKEREAGETRAAATPETVRRLRKLGLTVVVEQGAGEGSFLSDQAFTSAGAQVLPGEPAALGVAELVLAVNPPTPAIIEALQPQALIISFLWPQQQRRTARALVARRLSAFAMEAIPRISRAQGMDALSSQSNIAGYKAALLAASALPRLMPMLMTAAGTMTPARVVVLGAGVAGLQAIATARRLGAVVEVSDVRLAVKEQVQSLGARFLEVAGAEDLEGEGGYARQASAEFLARQQQLVAKHVAAADAVITTALVPGKRAPVLVTRQMVEAMQPGAVIVDLAVEQGGNCELSQPGQELTHRGVRIIGLKNLPGLVPVHASEMYAKNVLQVVEHLLQDGALNLDLDDPITGGALLIHQGEPRAEGLAQLLEER